MHALWTLFLLSAIQLYVFRIRILHMYIYRVHLSFCDHCELYLYGLLRAD